MLSRDRHIYTYVCKHQNKKITSKLSQSFQTDKPIIIYFPKINHHLRRYKV